MGYPDMETALAAAKMGDADDDQQELLVTSLLALQGIAGARLDALKRVGKALRDERRETKQLGVLLVEKEYALENAQTTIAYQHAEIIELRVKVGQLQNELHDDDGPEGGEPCP